MSLSKRAATALEKSIAHWKRLASGERKKGEAPSSDWCALCALYIHSWCSGACPVFKVTSIPGCEDTPFGDAIDAWRGHGLDSPEFKAVARAEVKFLEGLRDE